MDLYKGDMVVEKKNDSVVLRVLTMLPVGVFTSPIYPFGENNEVVECGGCSFVESSDLTCFT